MNRKITKIALATIIALISLSANAQFTRLGGGLSFCTGIEKQPPPDGDGHKTGNPGFNLRGVLELSERFWLEPGLTFYLPGKQKTPSNGMAKTLFGTVDVDVTFAMATEKTILFYALAGANLSMMSTSFEEGGIDNENKFMPALNVGTGIEMIIERNFNAFAQVKGVIGTYSQNLVISIGVHYYIKGRRYKSW
jgi:hypothetical protein